MFFYAGHLFHVGSRLQHSKKVGVLVSMVLVLTLLLCTCGSSLERTDGRAGARDENAPLVVDATCKRVNLMLIMTDTNYLATKVRLAWCFTASRPSTWTCRMKASAQWNCCAPDAFPLSKVVSFTGLNDERKLRLWNGFGSLWMLVFMTVSANLNVSHECRLRALACLSITSSTNSSTTVSASGSLAGKKKNAVRTRDVTSSMQMARRKTWPEGVAVRCGRKAWLKSVVLRRACRDRGRELSWLPVVSARSFGVQLHDNDPHA